MNIGLFYELAGDFEKAIDLYETGYRIRGPGMPYLGAFATPELQSNPRFIRLLRDMKLDHWVDKYMQAIDSER